MSSLRQNLQAHRAAESPASYETAEERQAALIVASWCGESWVLPWSQFVSARLDKKGIELTFANVVVILEGDTLAPLLNEIAAFRLGCLRDLPADYRRKPADGQPFITRIEVRSLAAATREAPG